MDSIDRVDHGDLFAVVHGRLSGTPARRDGEYHADCPYCGKEAKRGQTHFTYSPRGGHCFVCGGGGGLVGLARHLGLFDDSKAPSSLPRPTMAEPAPPPPPPAWRAWRRAEYMDAYYPCASTVAAAWRASSYDKPVTIGDVVRHWLGYGVLPGGHERRLIVPIFGADGRLACMRGRLPDSSGWMSPAGWRLAELPLFNLRSARPGDTIVVVENAVDAILLSRHYEQRAALAVAVATLSVSYWTNAWDDALVALKPARVLVVYDNDLAGNGVSDDEARAAEQQRWRDEKRHEPPPARGPLLAQRLQRLGLRASVYQYPPGTPVGADPGDFIRQRKEMNQP